MFTVLAEVATLHLRIENSSKMINYSLLNNNISDYNEVFVPVSMYGLIYL